MADNSLIVETANNSNGISNDRCNGDDDTSTTTTTANGCGDCRASRRLETNTTTDVTVAPETDAIGVGPERSLTLLAYHQQRYDRFLEAYFGYGVEQRTKCIRQAAQMCMIGLGLQKKGQTRHAADMVHAMRHFLRHSVLAVEGDAVFVKLVQRARLRWCDEGNEHFDDPRQWPNARCIALHYDPPQMNAWAAATSHCSDSDAKPLFDVKAEPSSPQERQFPRATLIAVVATTPIEEGEAVRLCLRSYHRCLDEGAWYEELFGPRHNAGTAAAASSVTRGQKVFDMWPEGLPFFHGVGLRHAGPEPVAGFPFTLLDLAEAREIGKGEKGLFAAHPVPYATCFLYCGPAVATKVVEKRRVNDAMKNVIACSDTGVSHNNNNSNDNNNGNDDNMLNDIPFHDATYALGLGQHGICFGQGLMRYANHRYNLSKFGNVELCSVMLSVTSEFSSLAAELQRRREAASGKRKKKARYTPQQKSNKSNSVADAKMDCKVMDAKKRRYRPLVGRRIFLEEHSHFVTIPFFIATTDIEEGHQLLAWTYGEEYDARLERQVVCHGNLVPYADAALLETARVSLPQGAQQCYKGDYRHGMGIGDIVWCRQPSSSDFRDPVDDLFVILDMPARGVGYLLLRPLMRSSGSQCRELLKPCQELDDDDNDDNDIIVLSVCEAKVLERCIIAHMDTVALLLVDMDYWTLTKAKRSTASSPLAWSSCSCGGGSSCLIHHVVVRGKTLRAATRLVLESEDAGRRAMNTRFLAGSVWPFLQKTNGIVAPSRKKEATRSKKS